MPRFEATPPDDEGRKLGVESVARNKKECRRLTEKARVASRKRGTSWVSQGDVIIPRLSRIFPSNKFPHLPPLFFAKNAGAGERGGEEAEARLLDRRRIKWPVELTLPTKTVAILRLGIILASQPSENVDIRTNSDCFSDSDEFQ